MQFLTHSVKKFDFDFVRDLYRIFIIYHFTKPGLMVLVYKQVF